MKLLQKNADLCSAARTFLLEDAEVDELVESGCTIIGAMYGNKLNSISLNKLRFLLYKKKCLKSTTFKLESLPPTIAAAKEHIFRVYLQVQQWLGNELSATDWGWQKSNVGLRPMYTTDTIIPDELLETFACSCKTGCVSNKCTCKSHGLECTDLCENCDGQCDNCLESFDVDFDEENENNVNENDVNECNVNENDVNDDIDGDYVTDDEADVDTNIIDISDVTNPKRRRLNND